MIDVEPGQLVVVSLHSPREKLWGVLVSMGPPGIVLRGIDLAIFEEWTLQESLGTDPMLGPTTIFFPMSRLDRIEADESVGPVPSYGSRFESACGRSAVDALGWNPGSSARSSDSSS